MLFVVNKNSIQLGCQAELVEADLHKETRLRRAQADIIII
jgi:capsule polysaccharide export protein KpsC/LpsZ